MIFRERRKTRMNRSFAAFAVVACLAIPAAALSAGLSAVSRWSPAPVRVDGLGEEWTGDARTSLAETPADLAFRNDGRNVYILFEFRETLALGTIAHSGLALYKVSPENGKRLGGSRLFVRTVAADRFVELLERQGRILSDRDKVEIRMRPFYPVFEALAIDGKGKVLAEPALPPGEDPPGFKVAEKDGVVIYEIRIPFIFWTPVPGIASPAPGDALSLEFEWGGPVVGKNQALPNGLPGVEFLRVITPNASPVTAQRKDPMYKKHTIRVDVTLAAAPGT
jgi:hypothetical protein